MSDIQTLFGDKEIKELIKDRINDCEKKPGVISKDLKEILTFFYEFGRADDWCQTSIKNNKNAIVEALNGVRGQEIIFLFLYRCLREISLRYPLENTAYPYILNLLSKYSCDNKNEKFNSDFWGYIKYTNLEFPINLVGEIVRGKEISEIKKAVEKYSQLDVDQKNMAIKYENEKTHINGLLSELKNIKTGLNFAKLAHGFGNISKTKSIEMFSILGLMILVQVLLIGIPVSILYLYGLDSKGVLNLEEVSWKYLFAHASPIFAIEMLLIYLFRVLLHQYANVKTVLLQISLRKNLCQFIEEYTEFANKAKEKDPNSLEKFESLVFSGLIYNQDQLPSSFDGLDQIVKMVDLVKKKV